MLSSCARVAGCFRSLLVALSAIPVLAKPTKCTQHVQGSGCGVCSRLTTATRANFTGIGDCPRRLHRMQRTCRGRCFRRHAGRCCLRWRTAARRLAGKRAHLPCLVTVWSVILILEGPAHQPAHARFLRCCLPGVRAGRTCEGRENCSRRCALPRLRTPLTCSHRVYCCALPGNLGHAGDVTRCGVASFCRLSFRIAQLRLAWEYTRCTFVLRVRMRVWRSENGTPSAQQSSVNAFCLYML